MTGPMRSLDRLLMRIRMLFHRDRAGRQLEDELQFHLDQQIAENLVSGMSAGEARSIPAIFARVGAC